MKINIPQMIVYHLNLQLQLIHFINNNNNSSNMKMNQLFIKIITFLKAAALNNRIKLSVTKNLRQKSAKIGLIRANVIMVINVNLHMVKMSYLTNKFLIKIAINLNNVIASILKCSVLMVRDVFLYMKTEPVIN